MLKSSNLKLKKEKNMKREKNKSAKIWSSATNELKNPAKNFDPGLDPIPAKTIKKRRYRKHSQSLKA